MRLNRWAVAGVLLVCASLCCAADPPRGIELKQIAAGFENPLYFIADPAGRNFVVEQRGTVQLLQADGRKAKEPFLDITDRVYNQGECGLLSLAFDPAFAKNGRLFVNYVIRQPGVPLRSRIAEYHVDPKGDRVDPATEKIIFTLDQPYPNHKGGLVIFGPDGKLYCGFGDGGAGGDPQNRAQNLHELHGKILRIDVDADPSKRYTVPSDNPFVNDPKAFPEVWCYGMRNPWRFSFDRETGTLYCGDVGQDKYEEIDIITRGGNYGWRLREGLHPFGGDKQDGRPVIDPIVEYDHHTGQSITGGYVYRGKQFPELQGIYIYADFATGRFWGLKYDGQKMNWQKEFDVSDGRRTGQHLVSCASFGEDKDGELYVCDHGRGKIWQVTPMK